MTTPRRPASPAELANGFRAPEDVLHVLMELRAALNELLLDVGVDPAKTRATARQLDLDRNLVWRLTRLASAEDVLAVTPDIPTAKHFAKLCETCREHGAEGATVRRLEDAVVRFEEMVECGLGGRDTLEAMAAGLEQDNVTARQENARRLAFLSNSAIWGVQARVSFKTTIHAPSRQREDRILTARVCGMSQFRRLRPIAWPLHRMHGYNDDGTVLRLVPHPLAGESSDPDGLPLLPRFCSQPLPEVRTVATSYGRRYELPGGPIGNAGALTCVFADVFTPEFERYRTADDRYLASMIDLITPSEYLYLDMILHRDLVFPAAPEALLLDRLGMERGYEPGLDELHQLPLSVRPVRLGAGVAGVANPHYPEYGQLMNHVIMELGFEPADFRGYRLVLRYPPVPSAAVMRFTYPDPPSI